MSRQQTLSPTLGSRGAAVVAREAAVAAPNYAPLPVVLTRASGVWAEDVDGRRYLDMMSGYSAVSLGHGHPRILAALTEQAGRLALTSRAYHTDRLAPWLETLTSLAGFDLALPMNTGAEAVETAIKAARRWGYRVRGIAPDRARIVVAQGSFHGRTTTIVGFSSEAAYRDGFGPFAPGFDAVPFGDADALRAAIGPDTAAVMIEPMQGEAGIVIPPDGYLAAVRRACDEAGVLLVLDEVQTGLGRTGRLFAFEHEGIRPDVLILGKALGGGVLPVSAVLADRAVLGLMEPGSHGSTFGGNPLAAAVSKAALDVIVEERLPERAAELGAVLIERLSTLRGPGVRDVRGRGLFVGVELDPAVLSAHDAAEALLRAGILTKETHETVLRFAPPLVISRADLDEGIDRILTTLRALLPA